MTREERLQQIARELYEAKNEEKQATSTVKGLRDEFFRLHDEEFKGKEHLLPIKTIEVPDEFFATTGMTKTEFAESRLPGWDVQHCEYNPSQCRTVFVLRRNPHYISGVVEVNDEEALIRVSKEISEFTPEIDWETLRQEDPELARAIGVQRIEWDIDENAFEEQIEKNPEVLAKIQRHLRVREPVVKITTRKVKEKNG